MDVVVRSSILALLPVSAALGLALPASAQAHKLNAALARPAGGDVRSYRLSTNGDHVVFVADQDADDVYELFTARLVFGTVRREKLSGPLPPEGDVVDCLIAPGDQRVVYRGDQDTNNQNELYSVPIDGGTPVKLSTPPVAVGLNYAASPDGTRVAYLGALTPGVIELYAAPLDGSAPAQKLSPTPVAGGDVQAFRFSPDGQRVIYLADQEVNGRAELYSAVLDGSRLPVKISGALVAGGSVGSFEISADGARVVYRADQVRDEQFELFGVPLDGGAVATLSALPDRRNRDVMSFALAGARAVYRADQDTQDVFEAYGVPLDGSLAPVRLNAPLAAGQGVLEIALAPDGSRAAFVASSGTGSSYELFSAPSDGSAAAVRLNAPLPAFGTVMGGFQFTPDSTRVVYEAEQDVYPVTELYLAPADGSAPPSKLSPPLVSGGNVLIGFAFAGNQGVVFKADALTFGVVELFSAPLTGGPAVRLNGPLVFGGDVDTGVFLLPDVAYQVSANGQRVVYLADQEEDETFELFGVPVTGSRPARKLNESMPLGPITGDVVQYDVSADGAWSVYLADQQADGLFELFRVSAFGGGPVARLSADLVLGGGVQSFRLSPDGSRAIYRADQDADEVYELYMVPLDGSAPAQRLSGTLVAGGDVVTGYEFTPDGVRVLYAADQEQDGVDELYSVRADGSAPPVKLSVLGAGGAVVTTGSFLRVSPLSDRVVYVADAVTDELYELFSVPTDGSAPPVKLNGPIVPTSGDVGFGSLLGILARISPTGDRVLYLADQLVDRQLELFSVPLDGSLPAVKLSGAPLGQRAVGMPVFTSDGQRTLYTGSEIASDRRELYVVPSDGSAPALLLTPGLAPGVEVEADYQVAAGDVRAVYRADAQTGDVPELYSVPLDASAPPKRLNGALVGPNPGVRAEFPLEPVFRLSPDGLHAVYTATEQNASANLYSVPVDGSAPSVLLSKLHDGGFNEVSSDFQITPDARTVLYVQDPHRLFEVPLLGGRTPRMLDPVSAGGVEGFLVAPDGDRVIFRGGNNSGPLEIYLTFLTAPHRPAAPPTGSVTRTVTF